MQGIRRSSRICGGLCILIYIRCFKSQPPLSLHPLQVYVQSEGSVSVIPIIQPYSTPTQATKEELLGQGLLEV